MALIFDGRTFAAEKEKALTFKLAGLHLPYPPKVWVLVFSEDSGSVLYTKLKQASAARIGIIYAPQFLSFSENLATLKSLVKTASSDHTIVGVMIQKPWKEIWKKELGGSNEDFDTWWNELVSQIDPSKDVDGLTGDRGKILPATVRAVLSILEEAKSELSISEPVWQQKKVVVIGRSDIIGRPLARVLQSQFSQVSSFGRSELLAANYQLQAYDVVISATGSSNLITGEMIKEGAIVIDVGTPDGDIERTSVEPKAAFLTPVPGGVGPVTVVSLMENVLDGILHL